MIKFKVLMTIFIGVFFIGFFTSCSKTDESNDCDVFTLSHIENKDSKYVITVDVHKCSEPSSVTLNLEGVEKPISFSCGANENCEYKVNEQALFGPGVICSNETQSVVGTLNVEYATTYKKHFQTTRFNKDVNRIKVSDSSCKLVPIGYGSVSILLRTRQLEVIFRDINGCGDGVKSIHLGQSLGKRLENGTFSFLLDAQQINAFSNGQNSVANSQRCFEPVEAGTVPLLCEATLKWTIDHRCLVDVADDSDGVVVKYTANAVDSQFIAPETDMAESDMTSEMDMTDM